MDDGLPIVVDIGSGTIKAGYAGEDAPRVTFPSVVGHVRQEGSEVQGDSYVGDEALANRNVLNVRLVHPIERSIVTSWEDMEKASNSFFFLFKF